MSAEEARLRALATAATQAMPVDALSARLSLSLLLHAAIRHHADAELWWAAREEEARWAELKEREAKPTLVLVPYEPEGEIS